MDGKRQSITHLLASVIRNPGSWLILALLILITLPHYGETSQMPVLLTQLTASIGLTRHAFERILYLAPIVWAGFIFGWKGAFITSLTALVCMLPRAIFISSSPPDALFETSAVFIIANVLAVTSESLRRERKRRRQLEITQQELEASEERYRGLFENAHDAIWSQDMEGNILTANEATARLTGYNVEELVHMNVKKFLSGEELKVARDVRKKLLKGDSIGRSYDQRTIRKDGTEAFLRLSTSLVRGDGKLKGFQHIARDVTEEKRMHDNLRFYLQQATRAQEEERKRISRELHDETIQELVVLSRQLDAVTSKEEELSEDSRHRLEELRQQTNNIIKGVRRLSQDLRPAALDRLGLIAALEWLAADVQKYSGISTKLSVIGSEHRLPEEVELILFRITQEALRNVWRHSKATKAEITVEFGQNSIKITVNDNGKGFNPPHSIGDLTRNGKLGLAGIEERARLIGGTLTVESQPDKGTSLTIDAMI